MRVSVKAIRTSEPLSTFIRRLPVGKELYPYLGLTLQQWANGTVDVMEKKILSDGRKRQPVPPSSNAKSNLAQALRSTVRIFPKDKAYYLGIGNTTELDRRAPYWYVLNYGGSPWKGASFFGSFQDGRPRRGGGGQTWFLGGTVNSGVRFLMRPKKPIRGIHYLEAGVQWLITNWKKAVDQLAEDLRSGKPIVPAEVVSKGQGVENPRPYIPSMEALQEKRQIRVFGKKLGAAKWRYSRRFSVDRTTGLSGRRIYKRTTTVGTKTSISTTAKTKSKSTAPHTVNRKFGTVGRTRISDARVLKDIKSGRIRVGRRRRIAGEEFL